MHCMYVEHACLGKQSHVMVRSGWLPLYHAIMIKSSTYVGMITVDRAMQSEKVKFDMVTREVGRDRLVRAWLARRESYKRRR